MRLKTAALPLLFAVALPLAAAAQPQLPEPATASILPAVPDPADTAWPGGAITLFIDASDIERGVFSASEDIPLPLGARHITLLFPQWLPGNHAPRGPLAELVNMQFVVDGNGRALPWRRDPVEVNAFHVDLPAGARVLRASFVHTSPLRTSEGRITMTPEMLNLQWEKMSLYPAGHAVRRIRVLPQVKLPAGWKLATALDGVVFQGGQYVWPETDYETLVDSPIFAGAHYRAWALGNAVTLNVFADEERLLAAAPANIARISAMTEEALLVFGRLPNRRYNFLVALSDKLGGIGLEHLASSEIQLEPHNFIDWPGFDWDRNVLGHELAHAWNGKSRLPAGMRTPDYRQPTQNNLLWLYEGQTQFWGYVLAARSGTQSKDIVFGMLASQAGKLTYQRGRSWRSVEDTTFDPVFAARKPRPYANWSRDEDYYNEGALVWLEADQIIREGTAGARGLDDFAKAFFAHPSGSQRQMTYEFGDIGASLNRIFPFDWSGFLRDRFEKVIPQVPTGGITRGGYQLVWRGEPNAYDKAVMDNSRALNLMYSLGVTLDKDGVVIAADIGGPAAMASPAIVNGARIVAVNGTAYDAELLRRAIAGAKGGSVPIELLVRRGDRFAVSAVPYYGGLNWPWLERTPGFPALAPLDRLLAPRRSGTSR